VQLARGTAAIIQQPENRSRVSTEFPALDRRT
jgi:hypothetical protein